MHMVQEVLSPGRYKYKVYNARGTLLFVGESASCAQTYYEIGERQELEEAERNARLSRDAGDSGRSKPSQQSYL